MLGLASFLKEEKSCKVVFLLNDEGLAENERVEFETYLEKVADVTLVFAPSSEYASTIALPNSDAVSSQIRKAVVALGISNIRVIKKIERSVRTLEPIIQGFSDGVLSQAINSLALFTWAHLQRSEAPPIDFIVKMNPYGVGRNIHDDGEPDEEENAKWRDLLQTYGYIYTDELDLALLSGVKSGFHDAEKILPQAQLVHDRLTAENAQGSLEDAWKKFHNSFDDDEHEVLDGIYSAFKSNVIFVSPGTLDATIRLFKDIGRTKQAKELLDYFFENRGGEPSFYDLDEYAFSDDIIDPDVRQGFAKKNESLAVQVDLLATLQNLKDGWNPRALSALADADQEFYIDVFQTLRGRQLSLIVRAAVQLDRVVNADPDMLAVSRKAKEALRTLASQSDINRLRAEKFGVKIDDGPA